MKEIYEILKKGNQTGNPLNIMMQRNSKVFTMISAQ